MGSREPGELFVSFVRMRMCLDDDVLDPNKVVVGARGMGEEMLGRCG